MRFAMTDAFKLTATEISSAYKAGDLSPVEVLQSVRARVEQVEPLIAACWAIDFGAAIKVAQASEQRWRTKTQLSAIDGIPISIKEMIATAGTPRPVGTAAGDMSPSPEDAPPAARVREAGAVIWGKTTNPDFGMLSSGLSSFHKLARNPWNLELTPGGSSAGAAAAAAAQYGPLHLGTDIGGSLRLPAGWCGIFTLKPSFGRVPIYPPFTGRVAGPMTRTVADSALLMQELCKPDPRDYLSLPPVDIDWNDLDLDITGVRIGLMTQAGCGSPVSAEVKAAIEAAAIVFENAGAIIQPVEPFLTQAMLDGLDTFWRTRFLSETSRLTPQVYARILPYIREWGEGASNASSMEVYQGFNQIAVMQETGLRHFEGLDLLISPVAPEPAFPAEWPSPTCDPAKPFEHIGFTVAYNMTGQPAASINCGFTIDGLPIGMQIVGKRFGDLKVMQLAQFWENARPHPMEWPRLKR
jgi:aspartyl-tRNA(Asn)/glutamyl-tRNA(Gln) amidotransferase subunit A